MYTEKSEKARVYIRFVVVSETILRIALFIEVRLTSGPKHSPIRSVLLYYLLITFFSNPCLKFHIVPRARKRDSFEITGAEFQKNYFQTCRL